MVTAYVLCLSFGVCVGSSGPLGAAAAQGPSSYLDPEEHDDPGEEDMPFLRRGLPEDPETTPGKLQPGVPGEFGGREIDQDLDAAEGRVREIVESLTLEMDRIQQRIQRIGDRIRSLSARLHVDEAPGPEALPRERREGNSPLAGLDRLGVREEFPWLAGEEQRNLERLQERQDRLLERWVSLGRVSPENRARSEELQQAREAERVEVRRELRSVLAGILDLRERGRRRRLEMLQEQLESIETHLDARLDDEVRRRLVEQRLEGLLERKR